MVDMYLGYKTPCFNKKNTADDVMCSNDLEEPALDGASPSLQPTSEEREALIDKQVELIFIIYESCIFSLFLMMLIVIWCYLQKRD